MMKSDFPEYSHSQTPGETQGNLPNHSSFSFDLDNGSGLMIS